MLGTLEASAVAARAMLGVEAATALGLAVGEHTVPHRARRALTGAARRLRADDDRRYECKEEQANESPHGLG